MKPKKLTLLSITVLTTLLIGAFTINTILASTELKLNVCWLPSYYKLNKPAPHSWIALVFLSSSSHKHAPKIDPSTILLEGTYEPESKPRPILWGCLLIVSFNGQDVLEALMTKAEHLSPGIYHVSLEITAETYDGTPCRGSSTITLTVPEPHYP
jgi:hypothetical protein